MGNSARLGRAEPVERAEGQRRKGDEWETRMKVSFADIEIGKEYTRPELAEHWGYKSWEALARGVVTPAGTNLIVLFVTAEKQRSLQGYADALDGDTLTWEGPTDHFAEDRMVNHTARGDEVHLFFRDIHHAPFRYRGRLEVLAAERAADKPSRFLMSLRGV